MDRYKTRIIPYADPQSEVGTTNRIYGSPVDSAYINNYPDVYTEHVQFTEEQGVKDIKSLNKIAKITLKRSILAVISLKFLLRLNLIS